MRGGGVGGGRISWVRLGERRGGGGGMSVSRNSGSERGGMQDGAEGSQWWEAQEGSLGLFSDLLNKNITSHGTEVRQKSRT